MKKWVLFGSVGLMLGGCASMQQKIGTYLPRRHVERPQVHIVQAPVVQPAAPVVPPPVEQIKRRWHFPAIIRHKIQR